MIRARAFVSSVTWASGLYRPSSRVKVSQQSREVDTIPVGNLAELGTAGRLAIL